MKKLNVKFTLLTVITIFAITTSCTNDVDQSFPAVNAKPVGTLVIDKTSILELDNMTTPTVDESVVKCTLNMSQGYKTNMKYKVEFLPSESTGNIDDVEVVLEASPIDFGTDGFLLTVPAFETSVNFDIKSVFDILPEQAETLKFRVYPVGDLNGAINPASEFFTLTLGNSKSDALKIIFDWNGDATFKGLDNATYHYSDFDFDLEIYDSSFSTVLESSYSASPESIDFANTYADGTYYIVPSFWSNPAVAPMLPINFAPKVTVSKPGVFVKEFDMSGVWNSTIGGFQQGNPDAYNVLAYFVKTTVAGEAMYQLFDTNDVLLVSGKMANLKNAFEVKAASKRK